MRKRDRLLIEERVVQSNQVGGITEVLLTAELCETQLPHLRKDKQTHRHDMSPNPPFDVAQRLSIRLLLGDFNRNLDVLAALMSASTNG